MMRSRRVRQDGHAAHTREMINAYQVLVGKPEGKRTLGRSGCKFWGNIKIEFKETGCKGVNWIHMAQDRFQ
jgi:hypothetical protein